MRISLTWIKKYCDFSQSPEELAELLTMRGLEVEDIHDLGAPYKNFYVGKVLSAVKHPNANKLTVCMVDAGIEGLRDGIQIICGAPNVQAGQFVPVGIAGAVVPRNQHDPEGKPFVLSKVAIRGEESNGMICSEYELGIGDDADGIMVLKDDAAIGLPLAEYFQLDDVVFEIGVTPNRADCLSHIGIAREIASLTKKALHYPDEKPAENSEEQTASAIQVIIENEQDCPRYTARVIKNVKVGQSPQWLQKFLRAVGIRPINNIVDITNFVMYEVGQPLHAFDYLKIAKKTIIVRSAKEGEKFFTLDGIERNLPLNALMICDGERAVAVAGIMGGLNSEISDATSTVLLESAYFNPSSVRRTAKILGLSTDASQRFERGTDPNITGWAIDRASQLITELAGGEILQGMADVYPSVKTKKLITLRFDRVNRILGTALPANTMMNYLTSVGIDVLETINDHCVCAAPTFRPDITDEIDLVEEVARIHGYSNIEDKMVSTIDFSQSAAPHDISEDLRKWLQGNGFSEIVCNNLMDEEIAAQFSADFVRVKNPISREMSAMRPSSIPSLLQTVFYNQNHGVKDIKVFEFGRKYLRQAEGREGQFIPGFSEKKILSLCITGNFFPLGWNEVSRHCDIFDMKGIVSSIFKKILLDKFSFIYYDSSSSLTDETIGIEIQGGYAGYFGSVRKDIVKKFQIDTAVYVAEIETDALQVPRDEFRQLSPLSRFPSVMRDLAFVVGADVPAGKIQSFIRQTDCSFLQSVQVFDVFEGESLPSGKKSVAFALEFNSPERTLAEKDIQDSLGSIIAAVRNSFGGELRSLNNR